MIYTVNSGDTLYSIAKKFNTTVPELVNLNGLNRPNDLAIGQHLFIPDNTQTTYTVLKGDNLYQLAKKFGISLNSLINANPQITNPNIIQIGQIINIPAPAKNKIEVNGYAIANISSNTLEKVLPNLTYLSIFSYQAKADGSMYRLYEDRIISTTRNARVAPVMVVTNIGESGGFSSDLASTILNNETIQNTLINNIVTTAKSKNYYGVDIDWEYIYPSDKNAFINFLKKLKARLVQNELKLSVAVAPKYRDNQQGILYEAHDYSAIGQIADRVIIMTYEWGYAYGEPMPISPYTQVEYVIAYAVTRIPSNKILMGMPNYAYDWTIPFKPGTMATTLSNSRALDLALDKGANIMSDDKDKTPYFNYIDNNNEEHIVWFEDALSISSRLELVNKYKLAGVSYWTVNNYYAINWTILNSMFDVTKVI